MFTLDQQGGKSPDAPNIPGIVEWFVSVERVISNWSITQSLGVTDQLKAGVRYFDIRVSSRPGTSELFIVHGLYGPKVESCMESLAAFLDDHCSEIVLLDFNHFYAMDSAEHERLINALLRRFIVISFC